MVKNNSSEIIQETQKPRRNSSEFADYVKLTGFSFFGQKYHLTLW
jgi:hypothetical protein